MTDNAGGTPIVKSGWSDADANAFIQTHGAATERGVALTAYAARLAGSQSDLAMHGGGNASFKGVIQTVTGDDVAALFVKASGVAMDTLLPTDFVCLDQAYLKRLRGVAALSDEGMAGEFRTRMLRPADKLPSIETLMHAFLAPRAVLHTHPAAVLALTNRAGGEEAVAAALGSDVGVVPYAGSGLELGRAVADRFDGSKRLQAIVVMHHGLITWGSSAKQAFNRTIETVARAEEYLRRTRRPAFPPGATTAVETAWGRYTAIAPLLRGLLQPATDDPDLRPAGRVLTPLISRKILDILDSPGAAALSLTAALTPDDLVRTKAHPLFIENPDYENSEHLRRQLARGIEAFSAGYHAYIREYSSRLPRLDLSRLDLLPKVVLLPGLGAVCAAQDLRAARVVRDITGQTLTVKQTIRETGGSYRSAAAEHLFDMEFRPFQQAKAAHDDREPLRGRVAIVTGAAGAIGSGICEGLVRQGCHVAATDLAGAGLEEMASTLHHLRPDRALVVPLDVTDGGSVAAAFDKTVAAFGGVDIVVINAGLAHVSPLTELDPEAFRNLERVNVEGTLRMLTRAGNLFRTQNSGGDIVLVSTKNVFAPGAKFGAYSATKAAAHQLCRIASIEFAEIGVRVNMVSPDAVFSHREKRSGLWAQVGPERMKARGLDEKGLEEFYRQRNLLKARVTAEHVTRAVLFFVTRQTPTTGATIPVDGGLPDATPR